MLQPQHPEEEMGRMHTPITMFIKRLASCMLSNYNIQKVRCELYALRLQHSE
jgi:hypothetical protein